MAISFQYELSFAGIPFCLDEARLVRLAVKGKDEEPGKLYPAKYQPETELIQELNRLLPREYLTDFLPPRLPPHNLSNIARATEDWLPGPSTVRIGEWYYPTGASRWSVFRGLATSAQVKEMVKTAFNPQTAKPLILKSVPLLPITADEADYIVTSDMYMMPPRPLAEHGAGYNGLFLITLVDERWYWQHRAVTTRPGGGAAGRVTWTNLIANCESALGISVSYSVAAAYLYPEPDSQLYALQENAPRLLDALGYNIGRTFVRKLNGTYTLITNTASSTLVTSNRGTASQCIRSAGGDIFSTLTSLPAGNLNTSKNAVLPANVRVCFPVYVEPTAGGPGGGDVLDASSGAASPVPHFLNSRYANKRPSIQYEDSLPQVWLKTVAISDLGSYAGLSGSGLVTLHSTAKALVSNEGDTAPRNETELNTLATQLAQDLLDSMNVALDELYPGTYAWEPEGYHDILWTYSADRRLAGTRVFRSAWNQIVTQFQHSATIIPRGVGGPGIALTVRDSWSGNITTKVTGLSSGSYIATVDSAANLPTQNRWKALVGGTSGERILFDGTSGGRNLTVAWRGIDGTAMQDWTTEVELAQVDPNVTYGLNLETTEKMEFVYPAEWTSGGIQGIHRVPQIQTTRCLAGSGVLLLGTGGVSGTVGSSGLLMHWSGEVRTFDSRGYSYPSQELVWLVERNAEDLESGTQYAGQFAGYSKAHADKTAPIYLVEVTGAGGLPFRTIGGQGPNPLAISGQANFNSSIPDLFDDQFSARLTAPLTAGATTMFVNNRGLFPTPPFLARVNNVEDVRVTSINAAGTTWTIERAQNGFAARAHVENAWVILLDAVTTTLSAGIDNATTSLSVADAGGGYPKNGFPTEGRYLILIDAEVILVVAGSGTLTWTVERGINTTKAAHGSGTKVSLIVPGTARYRDLHFVGYTFAQPGRFPGEGFVNEPAQLYRESETEAEVEGFKPAYIRRWNPSSKNMEDAEQIWIWKPGVSNNETDETCLCRMVGWAKGRKVFTPDCCCGEPTGIRNCTHLRAAIDSAATSVKVAENYSQTRAVGYKMRVDNEVVQVTNRAAATDGSQGADLTVTRGVDGTSPAAHLAYAPICRVAAIQTTLNGAVGVADTTVPVLDGTIFPSHGQFYIEVNAGSASTSETMRVTAGAGTSSWTVARAQLGTTAKAHSPSVPVYLLTPQKMPGAGTIYYEDSIQPLGGNAAVVRRGIEPIQITGTADASGFYTGWRMRWDAPLAAFVRDIPIQVCDLNTSIASGQVGN